MKFQTLVPKFIKPPPLIKSFYSSLEWSIPVSAPIIYLTFDDGPSPEVTPWVLEVLKAFDARATFFLVGDNVRKFPSVVEKILKDHHKIGNHTFNHLDGWKTEDEKYLENISRCHQLVDSNLFRPPYGKIKKSQIKKLSMTYRIVMWSLLSYDFAAQINHQKILHKLKKFTLPGSIIVFHDSLKAEANLRQMLPIFLETMKTSGYSFHSL